MKTESRRLRVRGRIRMALSLVVALSLTLQLLPAQGVSYAFGQEDDAEAPVLADTLEHGSGDATSDEAGTPADDEARAQGASPNAESEGKGDDAAAAEGPQGSQGASSPGADGPSAASEGASPAGSQADVPTVRIRFDANVARGDPHPATGRMGDFPYALDGEAKTLPACAYVREGHRFAGWSTTSDGHDVPDDPATPDEDESLAATAVPDSQRSADLAWDERVADDPADPGSPAHAERRDLAPAVRDGTLTLYAQWEQLPQEEPGASQQGSGAEGPVADAGESTSATTSDEERGNADVASDDQDSEKTADEADATADEADLPAEVPVMSLVEGLANTSVAIANPNETGSQLLPGDHDPFANFGDVAEPEPATMPDFAWPAIDATASAENGVVVEVHAPRGAFPPGTALRVAAVGRDEFLDAVESATGKRPADARAVDISFVCDGRELEPSNGLLVDVSLRLRFAVAGEGHRVVHLNEKGFLEQMGSSSSTYASFEASGFSIYGIEGSPQEDPDVYERLRLQFVDSLGNTVAYRIVREGDILSLPDGPASTNSDEAFSGWVVGNAVVLSSLEGQKLSSANFDELGSYGIASTNEENVVVVTVRPTYDKVRKAYFYQNEYGNGDTTGNPVAFVYFTGSASSYAVKFDGVSYSSRPGARLIGWQDEAGNEYATDYSFTLDDPEARFWPLLEEGYWVRYVLGEDAGYLDSTWVPRAAGSIAKSSLSKPGSTARPGYTFAGWYLDSATSSPVGNTLVVDSEDVYVYAKWTARSDTKYYLAYWFEGADGTPGTGTYTCEYVDRAHAYTGTTGSQVKTVSEPTSNYNSITFPTADIQSKKSQYYFDSSKTNANTEWVTIQGDGSTVRNVYYSRKYWDITFTGCKPTLSTGYATTWHVGIYKWGQNIMSWQTFFKEQEEARDNKALWWDPFWGAGKGISRYSELPYSSKTSGSAQKIPFNSTQNRTAWAEFYLEVPDKTSTSITLVDLKSSGKERYFELALEYYFPKGEITIKSDWRTGYNLLFLHNSGAYNSNTGGTWFDDGATYNKNVTYSVTKTVNGSQLTGLQLYYKLIDYSIQYESEGGVQKPTKTVTAGTILTKREYDPYVADKDKIKTVSFGSGTKKYTFAGWYTSRTAAQNPDDESSDRFLFQFGSKMPASSFTLYAGWRIDKHTVKFDSNGGTEVSAQTGIESGSLASEPEPPSKDGFSFAGWYTDPQFLSKWDFKANGVFDDVTLYARWYSPEKYSVTYHYTDQNGSEVEDSGAGATYSYGASIPVREAPYATNDKNEPFLCWSTVENDVNGAVRNVLSVQEDMDLYAIYASDEVIEQEQPKAVVTFRSNYPMSLGAEDKCYPADGLVVKVNDRIILPDLKTTGFELGASNKYAFVGWRDAEDAAGTLWAANALAAVSGDTNIDAQWSPTREAGAAYAVLSDDGTLTLFRSDDVAYLSVTDGTAGTFTDIVGTSRAGRLYRVAEAGEDPPTTVPWEDQKGGITSVRVAAFPEDAPGSDGTHHYQAIHPATTAHWFDGCSNLTSVELPELDTSAVTGMEAMYRGCTSLASLDFGELNTSSVTSFSNMFDGCSSLKSLDIAHMDTSRATSMASMFAGCAVLREVTLGQAFSFKGADGTTVLAELNTPPNDRPYTGRWAKGSLAYKPSELAEAYDSTLAGTWRWESDLTSPYAVLEGSTLRFVLSDDELGGFEQGATVTLTDLDGVPHAGATWRIRDLVEGESSEVPWLDAAKGATEVASYGTQAISPVGMGGWFRALSALESADLRGLDTTTRTENMADAFAGCDSLVSVTLGPSWSFKGMNSGDDGVLTQLPTHDVSSEAWAGYTGKWAHVESDATYALAAANLAAEYPDAETAPVGTWVWQRLVHRIDFHKLDAEADAEGNEVVRSWYEWYGHGTYEDEALTASVTATTVALPIGAEGFVGYFTRPGGRGTLLVGADGRPADALLAGSFFHGSAGDGVDDATVDSNGVGHLYPHWQTDAAYAVLVEGGAGAGTLYFIRSGDELGEDFATGDRITIHDTADAEYAGRVWPLDELAASTVLSASDVPWQGAGGLTAEERAAVTRVVSFAGQAIEPETTAWWFKDLANLAYADLSGLVLTATSTTTDMFDGCDSLVRVTLGEGFRFRGTADAAHALLPVDAARDGLMQVWQSEDGSASYSPQELAQLFDSQAAELAGTWVRVWVQDVRLPMAGGAGQATAAAWIATGAACAAALWLRWRRREQ